MSGTFNNIKTLHRSADIIQHHHQLGRHLQGSNEEDENLAKSCRRRRNRKKGGKGNCSWIVSWMIRSLKQNNRQVLTINVKPGWKSGTKITFQREGDQVRTTF